MKSCLICVTCLLTFQVTTAIPYRQFTRDRIQPYEDSYGKIINGRPAFHGQFPYQAGILADSNIFCAGVLLSDQWVLTAGFCASNFVSFTITLGASRIDLPEPEAVVESTSYMVLHPDYDITNIGTNLALIQIPYPVTLSAYIKPVTLPSLADTQLTFEGSAVQTCGWGSTEVGGSYPYPTLLYADLEVMPERDCARFYLGIDERFLCAVGATYSICFGDQGGPLVLKSGGIDKLLGIAAAISGSGCVPGIPGGFVRITSHLDWISSVTGIVIADT